MALWLGTGGVACVLKGWGGKYIRQQGVLLHPEFRQSTFSCRKEMQFWRMFFLSVEKTAKLRCIQHCNPRRKYFCIVERCFKSSCCLLKKIEQDETFFLLPKLSYVRVLRDYAVCVLIADYWPPVPEAGTCDADKLTLCAAFSKA